MTLNNPVYRGGSSHIYKKEKQNSKQHKKDNSPVFGSVDFLQLWIAAQQLGFYGGSLGWGKGCAKGLPDPEQMSVERGEQSHQSEQYIVKQAIPS